MGTQSVPGRPLPGLLLVQAVSTFLFALVLNIAFGYSLALAILVAVTAAAMTKANGLYSGKSIYAIIAETSYVLAQAALILTTYYLFK